MYRINDLYKFARENYTALLSEYTSEDPDYDFWSGYTDNYRRYDIIFNRMFNSFWYFMQKDTDDLATVFYDFQEAVYGHLMINDKKYTELYRIQIIPDTDYSLTDNYDVTEHMEKEGSDNSDNTYGSRTDTGSDTTGNQHNTNTSLVAPYDSSTFSESERLDMLMGSRLDLSSLTKGQQIDDLNRLYSEEYTLTRKGNIGVQTATDMIDKHKKFWNLWSFYEYIFKEISKDLLLL